MLLKADAAQLEWRVKVFLSQDKVAMEELVLNQDLHTNNQKDFGLPNRGVAKIFVYRMIFADAFGDRGYNGPAYAYANDPKFRPTSTSVKFWEGVIDRFFTKYQGIYQHSLQLIQAGVQTGRILSPSGREYTYGQILKRGEPDWPRSDMLNHIVQGFSADLILLARRNMRNYLLERPEWGRLALLINTVHDSIEMDVVNDPEVILMCSVLLRQAFQSIDTACQECYNITLSVPMDAEVKFGYSLFEADMKKFNIETFKDDYIAYRDSHS